MIGILFAVLKETVLAMGARIAFKAVAERFATRLVVYGLNKLKDYSSNDVVDETVQDVIDSLKGKRLKVVG